ncbi:MAG: hypothetical protein BWY93_00801 [Euryarchaeota archaeon ADurb.BinA087]|nr:MAG: hypothetical protein BWY93_00801 [Euryarchaeota archaeon ADurb.BinA087]
MNMRIVFTVVTISLIIISLIIAGCLSDIPPVREVPPSMESTSGNETQEIAIGDTTIVSSPEGSLEITVRAFNSTTGELHIEEKNIGTETFHYNPTLWLQDGNGFHYTTVYCQADLCPSYVFFTTLLPQGTEKRDFDSIYDTFRIPESARQGKLILFWSIYGQESSWVLVSGGQ